ncbi:VOC family protein [Nakamurella endophytica]|uniref:Glyoxalase n=1 Tax=Nakamurella endophytica TaxID=1748367 RepID=A0A917WIC8_9ACTN|nr:VOC family protein [Nakamurella endophytica]GGM05515.1 glyoxalase [Nakamurella endophytica]
MRGRTGRMWWGLALETPDPETLARFYSVLLDWPVVHREPGQAVLQPPQPGVFVVDQQSDGYTPPVWPPAPGEQRPMAHLDVQVEDLDAAVTDAVALGARLADHQPPAVRVLFDPVGHPFCLCRDDG